MEEYYLEVEVERNLYNKTKEDNTRLSFDQINITIKKNGFSLIKTFCIVIYELGDISVKL